MARVKKTNKQLRKEYDKELKRLRKGSKRGKPGPPIKVKNAPNSNLLKSKSSFGGGMRKLIRSPLTKMLRKRTR